MLLSLLVLAFGLGATADRVPQKPYHWGVVGDSFASSTGSYRDLDNRKCGINSTDSYGPQLRKASIWNGRRVEYDDQACAGSHLKDITEQMHLMTWERNQQLGPEGGEAPLDLLLMTSGLKESGYFDVIDNCVLHTNATKNYGPDYAEDVRRAGSCAQAIDLTKTYVAGTNGNNTHDDISQTIEAIRQSHEVNIRKGYQVKPYANFRLYVTGYPTFFNANHTWCNNQSFGVFGSPPLTQVLRKDMNDLITQFNQVVKTAVDSSSIEQSSFIPIDDVFQNHRFCEADHPIPSVNAHESLQIEYNPEKRFLYNLLPGIPSITPNTTDAEVRELIHTSYIRNNNASDALFSSSLTKSWLDQPFSPTKAGSAAIKDAIIAQMKTDALPPQPPPPPPPYNKGTCHLHVKEYQTCADDPDDLFAWIELKDAKDIHMGTTDGGDDGEPINVKDPYDFRNVNLPNPITVVGEHRSDYINFQYGGAGWTSKTARGGSTDPYCKSGDWDIKTPDCKVAKVDMKTRKREMDCYFQC